MAGANPVPPEQMLDLRLQLEQIRERDVVVLIAIMRRERLNRRRRRRWWVRPWIERRVLFGQYDTLMLELERECQGDFVNYLRMEPGMFYELLMRITPRIKKSTRYRKPLEPGLKLAITLRYIATGSVYKSLQYSFRVAHNTISLFIPEVCQAIIDEYQEEVFCSRRSFF